MKCVSRADELVAGSLILVALAACSSAVTAGDGAGNAGSSPAIGGNTASSAGGAGGAGVEVSGAGSAMGGVTAAGGASGGGGLAGAPVTAGVSGAGATGAGAGGAGATGAIGGSGPIGGTAGSTAGTPGAPQKSATGYGKAATGGGSAKAVTVTSMAAMQTAVDNYTGTGGLVLQYTGTFDFAKIPDPCTQHTLPAQTVEIKGKSDITIQGSDGSAANFGIHIASASSNIIIRNMTIGLTPGGGDSDLISLEGMSAGVPKDIWIDHNELFTSMAVCPGAGDTAFDGMIDIKKGADDVTVSYNYMHDHHKVSLNGYTDDDDAVRHITFDHNLFENIGSRTPLQRHGYSHVLNNYFLEVQASGVNVRMGGYSLVEANYFETVKNPVTARDSSAVGFWDLRANNLATAADVAAGNKFGISWDAGSAGTVNATAWVTTAAFPVALGYTYNADPFQCVHDGLRAVAGSGKGLPTLKCK